WASKPSLSPAAKAFREPPTGTRAALLAASRRSIDPFPVFAPSSGGSDVSDSTAAKEVKNQRRLASIALRDQLSFRERGGMVASLTAETDVGSGAQMEVVYEEAEDAEEAKEDIEEAEREEAVRRIICWCRRRILIRNWADKVTEDGEADGAADPVLDATDEAGKAGGQH
ncbi:hypothetical protein B484DRAFT_473548, partial [Ochromonadaceae sp. CCMP2298]